MTATPTLDLLDTIAIGQSFTYGGRVYTRHSRGGDFGARNGKEYARIKVWNDRGKTTWVTVYEGRKIEAVR